MRTKKEREQDKLRWEATGIYGAILFIILILGIIARIIVESLL